MPPQAAAHSSKQALQEQLAKIEAEESRVDALNRSFGNLKTQVEHHESRLATIRECVGRLRQWCADEEAGVLNLLEVPDQFILNPAGLGDTVNLTPPVFLEKWLHLQWSKLRVEQAQTRLIDPVEAAAVEARWALAEFARENPTARDARAD